MIDNNSKKFFIVKNGEKFGPYSISELQAVEVDKESLIWYNGLENWVKIDEVDELSQIFDQVPPPIPKSIIESTQNVIVKSPIDITMTKKSQFTKEESTEKKRDTTKYLLREFAFIFFFFAISALAGLMSHFFFSQINQPELVSEENQKMFNEEYSKRHQENQLYMAFGDIMYKYLGYYKYDDEIFSGSNLEDINKFRLGVLVEKSTEFGWYCFYILLGLLIVVRYLTKFIKWLNPSLMEEQNGLLTKTLGGSNSQDDSEKITQMDHNVQKETVETEKLIPVGWADNVSEVEKVVAQKLMKKIQPQHVIAKIISKNEMEVWSMRFWESVQDNSDYKLIYNNSI